jgi:hypothetical protein
VPTTAAAQHPDAPCPATTANHITDYATGPATDINDLTFACGPQHRLLRPATWTTQRHANGHTRWIPPAHHDRGQPRTNTFHHPRELLHDADDEDAA